VSNVDTVEPTVDLTINGAPPTIDQAEMFVSLLVERSASACDRFELRFDISQRHAQIATIGDIVKLGITTSTDSVSLITAEVTGKAVEFRNDRRLLVISGYDKRHRLTRTISTRAFKDMSFKSVADKIAGEHGLTLDDRTGGLLTATVHPHLIQAGSDFETIQQITHRVGAEWWIDDEKLIIRAGEASTSVVTLSPETNLVSLNVRFSPVETVGDVTVRGGWDSANKESIQGRAAAPDPLHTFTVESSERTKLTSGAAVSWAAPMTSVAEAEATAGAIRRRLVESAVVGHGETVGTPQLTPGSWCSITDVGSDFSGDYHISSVEHTFGRDAPYRTRFRLGPTEPVSLVSMLGAPDKEIGQVFNGVTIGIVTNNEHPDGRGGVVKVNFPYLGDEVESNWARLATMGGATGRGVVFIPEVDDEVIVAFEHGDVSRPYVLGTVWSGEKDSLFDTKVKNGKVDERAIVSKLGTKIRFVDAASGDATSGLSIEVDNNKTRLFFGYKRTELVTQGRPLEIKNGMASILMENDKITISAKEIALKATGGDVTVEGLNVTVKANTKLSLTGMTAEVGAQAQATLQASGVMTIKGSIVKVN
jgi:phage protein D